MNNAGSRTTVQSHWLHSRIRAQVTTVGLDRSLPTGPLAAAWIVTSLLWRLPDPFSLLSMFAFLFHPASASVGKLHQRHRAPGHDPNQRFTGWNIAMVTGGTIFFPLCDHRILCARHVRSARNCSMTTARSSMAGTLRPVLQGICMTPSLWL